MKDLLKRSDEPTRREFVSRLARTCLGVTVLPPCFRSVAEAGAIDPSGVVLPSGKAKNVIYLYMNGGMSHLDTFDPKPESEVQGPVETISTNVDGIRISEYFSETAQQMDKIALIRSLSSNQGAHERGQYYMRTGYNQRGTIRHPAMGAWALRLLGKMNPSLPGNVRIGNDSRHPGAGFMETQFAPLPIGDPKAGLQNSRLPKGIDPDRFEKRLAMSKKIGRTFRQSYDYKKVRAYSDAYKDAVRLMSSRELEVFDIGREEDSIKELYGEDAFGQGCLLARRLVEQGVRFVEVAYGGWDTHQNNFERVPERSAVLDRALSALVDDLSHRGLLDQTLVVVATEFGRTPTINQNSGRDHYPKAFSCLLAGGGVQGGQVYGRTSADGSEVIENSVSIPDFNATIAYALGMVQDEIVYSTSSRPFTVADKGKPITRLF
ncbi:MAG TPA: DUF1501 domain-containing protein [Verrucomicrobiales bacterium]|nr:DUF1501 domain-containing protein [Verrucomicrobiales bacterium]